jgi:hypothetical protein
MLLTGEGSLILPGWRRWKKSDRNIIAGDTVLNQDFKEFIQSLNDNGVGRKQNCSVHFFLFACLVDSFFPGTI